MENTRKIFVTRPAMPDFAEYIEEIKSIWESHWLTNMGEKHNQLEKLLADYLDTPVVTLFANGHLALEIVIQAFNLTGEVITTPFTFASTTHAIVRNRLEPIFCDINPDDYTLDIDKLEDLITEKTSAIVPVHVYGNICNVKAIERIAERYKLKVIYDAAHAFGVTYEGQGIANYGDASIFSFHATKVFNTIEGGAAAFRNLEFAGRLHSLRNFGITGQETVEFVGTNAKMNEFQAAMGICNMRYIHLEIEKRKTLAERYMHWLRDIKGVKLCPPQTGVSSNYAYFPVVFDGYKYTRDEVCERLKVEEIYARRYFYQLTNSFKCYQSRFDVQKTPVAQYIADRVLTLPLYGELTMADIDRICEIILV